MGFPELSRRSLSPPALVRSLLRRRRPSSISMALLRITCIFFVCCACAAGFMPAAAISRQAAAARSAEVCMRTAATKPQRVNKRNYEYNKAYKSEMRTRIRRVLEAVDEGDYSVAVPTLSKAFAIIDKNVKRNIIHRNTAARKKSQLHLKVKALESVPAAAPAPAAEE